MKANGIRNAAAVIILLLGLVIFIFNGFRGDVQAVEGSWKATEVDVKDHEKRVTVLETNYDHIRSDQREMKRDIKAIRGAVVKE